MPHQRYSMVTPSHIILLVVILLIVLVVFGASRIGDVGGALGKSVREFRSEVKSDPATSDTSDGSSS